MERETTDREPSELKLKKWIMKLQVKWQQLKSKSDRPACNLSFIPGRKAIVADAFVPSEVELFCAMCAMFPEGFKIPVQDLVIYGMGLKLFKDVRSITEARDRVYHLIRNLPFVDTEVDEHSNRYVKMQGVAYYSAVVAAKRNALLLNHDTVMEKWPNIRNCTSFFGLFLQKVSDFGLLHFRYDIEDSQGLSFDIFKGVEVRVLSLDVQSLPQSHNVLRHLRALCVRVVLSKDMHMIGGMLELEYLSLSISRLAEIPMEMGNLVNLRMLDLRKVTIAYIPPGLFSRMLKLEELYMPLSFSRWGCSAKDNHNDFYEWEQGDKDEYADDERINVSLREISHLSLTILQICVPTASALPKKSSVFRNIQRFKICLPDYGKYQPFGEVSLNTLQLTGDVCDIYESRICDLMFRAEDLSLTQVRNLKNVNYFMCRIEDNDLPQLKKMIVHDCNDLEALLSGGENWIPCSSFWELRNLHLSMLTNLKEILHRVSRWSQFGCFTNLRQVSIRFCHKLKYVFPLSIVREMRQIRSIEILNCSRMKGIFYSDVIDDSNYEVNFIEELRLHSLPKLMGFLVDKDGIIDEVDDAANISFAAHERFNKEQSAREMQQFVSGKQGTVNHTKLRCIFSLELVERRWSCLEKLNISFCDSVEIIFFFKKNHAATEAFCSLKELELYGLQNLRHIWLQIPSKIIAFQKLRVLALSECHNKYLLTPRMTILLVQLQKILISRCEQMEAIVSKDDREEADGNLGAISCPELKVLELQNMPNLRAFYGGAYGTEFPALESLKFNQCKKMEFFCLGPVNTPVLKKVEVNGSLYALMGDLNATISRLKKEA